MYDPTLPVDHTKATAAQVRGQFAGLKELIDALAAGTITAAEVDAVNTIAPGTPASVGVSVIGNSPHLTFSLPQGNDGVPGPPGINGNDGQQGPPGQPGEVSNAALASAIFGTSANTNSVDALHTPFTNDPPSLTDMETLRAKINEMLLAMRR